jgi:tellurite resistance protein TerC
MPETIFALLVSSWAGLPLWAWVGFLTIVGLVLAADLGLFHRDAHEPSFKESAVLAAACMSLGLGFSAVVWWIYANGYATSLDPAIAGAQTPAERGWHALELYLTGWFVEQTLAIDNIFVMSMIFGYFAIPPKYQHRVLFYGILGVIVLRAVMIGLGAALVHRFEWVLYVFAAFLIFTGIKMLVAADAKPDLEANPILRWMRRHIPITTEFEGQRFFVQRPDARTGKLVRHATPLFVALVLIEFADLIFAVDSVPAVFAITRDPFIVYTSNIFAILGLRALYVVLAAMVHRFHYLKYALALVLITVGAKIVAQPVTGKIPPELSLGVTLALLIGGIVVSLWVTRRDGNAEAARDGHANTQP